jgi:glycine--tRNA ligase
MGFSLQEIVSYAKRNGFVYPSSEIYDGFAGVYDYGPKGVELVRNIKNLWWREIVHKRLDTVGLDSAIFMSPKVWEASGHVSNFCDPLTECRCCHTRLRVDHVLEEIGAIVDDKMSIQEISEIFQANKGKIKCPKCGARDFTQPKSFNLLVKSNLGSVTDDLNSPVWLRGETCQGIYVDYLNVLNTNRVKIPFGIAQIGKAFRNEITARQFIFRTREFEQMENQRFVEPWRELEEYEILRKERMDYYISVLGLREENLRWKQHEKLAFYARAAWDIEYRYPFGFAELEGVHARGNYDLSQHSKYSGRDLEYRASNGETFIPHVIESSVGVGRTMLALLTDGLSREISNEGKERVVLKIKPSLAPIKLAIFPLIKNNPEIYKAAVEIYKQLSTEFATDWDDNGNIGKRYRRQDEIGTPCCVTVDYQTLEDATFTVRDRDTMEQKRMGVETLKQTMHDLLRI